jgi:two-component system sensor histidine kinase/response regulator
MDFVSDPPDANDEQRQPSILIVDDEPAALRELVECLEAHSLSTVVVGDGRDGLDRARHRQPDLIVLDVRMPGMDGYEVCRRLKADEETRDIPIIFGSAPDEGVDKVKGFEIGGVDHVAKPFECKEVLARVETHLAFRKLQKQLEAQNAQLAREIAERRQAETSLRESEQRYRALFTTSQRQAQELALLDQVRTALARELDLEALFGVVVEAIAKTFGYTLVALSVLENDVLVLQHQFGYEQAIERIPIDRGICGRVARTGKPVLLPDVRSDPDFLGPVDEIVSEVCIPLFDRGKVMGVLNVESTGDVVFGEADLQLLTALSEQINIAIGRVRLYTELRSAVEAAEAANRAKSAFLANMSHELRTPLNAVLGFAQLMERDPSVLAAHGEHLGMIRRSGEHLLQLINDVLELSRIETGSTVLSVGSFDLHRTLDQVEEMVRFRAESKGLQIVFERAPNLPRYVKTDERKLRQVLINLLYNACKFT